MLSRETCNKIKGICPGRVGEEIINRMALLQKSPGSIQDVKSILNALDTSEHMNSEIKKMLNGRMSNYDHGSCGFNISDGLSQCVNILQMALEKKDISRIKKTLREAISNVEFEALALALSSGTAARDFEKSYDKMLKSLVDMKDLQDMPEKEHRIASSIEVKDSSTEKTIKKRIYFRKVE